MKKILTRFASVFMALAMILLAIPAVEAKAAETVTIHFKNTENWSSVGVYTWSPEAYGTWPGTDISSTKDGDWYTATLTGHEGTALSIIFNDFGGGQQTVDLALDLTQGNEWWVVPKDYNGNKVMCAVETSKSAAEGGSVTVFEPNIPANPTVKNSPVIDGNKVTFYYECTNANTVSVAGSFNDWSATDMKKDGNVYSYTVELEAGTYQYKYVVNGNWYTDPFNKETADDGSGNTNSTFTVTASGGGSTTPDKPVDPNPGTTVTSPVVKDGKVTFNYASSTATKVEVFGNFNDWAGGFEMTKDGDVFTYTMELPNGEYEYKFVIDGTEWVNDPANSNQKNGNNVVTVTGGADAPVDPGFTPTITESVVIDGNKVTIYYESNTAMNVEVFGSMNAWAAGYQMTKDGNVFSYTFEGLEKGDYQYKFVVDGNWINDPLNENQADGNNVFGVTSDALATPDTEKPGTETPGTETDTEDKEPTGDAPTGATPMSDGVIILISAIVTIVVVLGGFAIYLFIKKKNA